MRFVHQHCLVVKELTILTVSYHTTGLLNKKLIVVVSFGFAGGGGVTFEIGEDAMGPTSLPPLEEEERGWDCVWRCAPATPVLHMAFSPDGTLFATAGRNDRLVKIWFENKHCKLV